MNIVDAKIRQNSGKSHERGSDQDTVITCRNLWKIYGSDPVGIIRHHNGHPSSEVLKESGHIAAVRDVSLDINRGEILAVMGLSGSGKSTFVRCLSRLVEPTAGSVQVEGKELLGLDEKALIRLRREKMGMVFQNFALLPHRTVLQNVTFPLEMRGTPQNDRRKRALEVIDLVGLSGREDYFPHELSGGQQQRVGIARSLAIEPDIWFLDEPFSALDPLIRREMQDELLRLQEMLSKTIVFITHDFDEALRLSDRIAIMYEGAIEQVDTPDRIVLSPATGYVERFTRTIAKSRVIRARTLIEPGTAGEGEPVCGEATIASLGRRLWESPAARVPVADINGQIIGAMNRGRALELLFTEDV
ncbi:ATP-binding cassette domain-containing protein [Halomonas sp. KX33721]|jgi:glycine betaine/proline transport system ATP-binding protein|uniref:quaternary amine ABC transporter ATP-binding protein n=1 Tax=Halomonas sp. KX33721 TaxID=1819251 RepID=UPI0009FFAD2C|nr:ATP-binding cassette domain-containing protein [Halomonas sp. KX33721]